MIEEYKTVILKQNGRPIVAIRLHRWKDDGTYKNGLMVDEEWQVVTIFTNITTETVRKMKAYGEDILNVKLRETEK